MKANLSKYTQQLRRSRLLIQEPPLQVLPSLAVEIGLNEAIAFQQLYWLMSRDLGPGNPHLREIEGVRWVGKDLFIWRDDHFPFWSESTIRRTFAHLRNKKLVKEEELDSNKGNRTRWKTIDFDELDILEVGRNKGNKKITPPSAQNERMGRSKRTDDHVKLASSTQYEKNIDFLSIEEREQLKRKAGIHS
jgi:hypothetical protein